MTRTIATALLLVVAGCRVGPVEWYHAAQRARTLSGRSTIALRPCVLRSLLGPLTLCGTYDVWEDRSARSGRRLQLHLVILPASGPSPDSDAVVPLDGGPGLGAATDAGIARLVRGAWSSHDIILLDQRGTGQSAPLVCPLYGQGRDRVLPPH